MSARKLQQEFDKTNKKIAEGLTLFDDTYEKFMTTELNSQREKFESDLKKEIKKLQRLRDQLKQWLGDNSIKLDKNILQENRGKIEHAMDQFKDLEKLSKIKQFSNEGLELQSKKGKLYKSKEHGGGKKQDSCDYVSDVIDQLASQNESLESDIHHETLLMKKAKSSAAAAYQATIDDLRYKIDRNNSHLSRLEDVLESLESDALNPEKIDLIRDDLDYYLENNQDEEYVEYDDFYDQLELDEEPTEDQDRAEREKIEQEELERVEQLKKEKLEKERLEKEALEKEKLEKEKLEQERKLKSTKTKATANSGTKQKVVPANPPPVLSGTSYSNAIRGAMNTELTPPPPTPPASGSAPGLASGPPPSTSGTSGTSAAPAPPVNAYSNGTTIAEAVSSANKPPISAPPGLNKVAESASSMANAATNTATATNTNTNTVDNTNEHTPTITANNALSKTTTGKSSTSSPTPMKILPIPQSQLLPEQYEISSFLDTIPKLSYISQLRLNNPLPYESINQLLENSLYNCPDSFDAEKPRQYTPQSTHPSSIDYPQEPMFELKTMNIMKRFDNDTLFYCFYYENRLSKVNAAKELSSRGWIFNNNSKQWLLPDNKNHDNETNFKYFDYEKTWLIRRKDNFTFPAEFRDTFV